MLGTTIADCSTSKEAITAVSSCRKVMGLSGIVLGSSSLILVSTGEVCVRLSSTEVWKHNVGSSVEGGGIVLGGHMFHVHRTTNTVCLCELPPTMKPNNKEVESSNGIYIQAVHYPGRWEYSVKFACSGGTRQCLDVGIWDFLRLSPSEGTICAMVNVAKVIYFWPCLGWLWLSVCEGRK